MDLKHRDHDPIISANHCRQTQTHQVGRILPNSESSGERGPTEWENVHRRPLLFGTFPHGKAKTCVERGPTSLGLYLFASTKRQVPCHQSASARHLSTSAPSHPLLCFFLLLLCVCERQTGFYSVESFIF